MTKPSSTNYRPRLAVEITPEQQASIQKLFPYGTQRAFFSKVIDEIIAVVEVGGPRAIAMILSEALTLEEVMPTMKRLKEVRDGDSEEPGDAQHNKPE